MVFAFKNYRAILRLIRLRSRGVGRLSRAPSNYPYYHANAEEGYSRSKFGCNKSGSRLRRRFGQVKMNNHGAFGVRRSVDLSPRSISDWLFVRHLRASRGRE